MARDARRLLAEALQLDPEARASLAAELLASLDPEEEADVEEAWQQEIARRLARRDAGESTAVAWEDLHRSLLGKLKAPGAR